MTLPTEPTGKKKQNSSLDLLPAPVQSSWFFFQMLVTEIRVLSWEYLRSWLLGVLAPDSQLVSSSRVTWREDSMALWRRQGQVSRNSEDAVNQRLPRQFWEGLLEPGAPSSKFFTIGLMLHIWDVGSVWGALYPSTEFWAYKTHLAWFKSRIFYFLWRIGNCSCV